MEPPQGFINPSFFPLFFLCISCLILSLHFLSQTQNPFPSSFFFFFFFFQKINMLISDQGIRLVNRSTRATLLKLNWADIEHISSNDVKFVDCNTHFIYIKPKPKTKKKNKQKQKKTKTNQKTLKLQIFLNFPPSLFQKSGRGV